MNEERIQKTAQEAMWFGKHARTYRQSAAAANRRGEGSKELLKLAEVFEQQTRLLADRLMREA